MSSSVGSSSPVAASEFSDRAHGVLLDIFSNVNGQLQFAETKNAALLAANVAIIVGVGAILAAESVNYQMVRVWLFVTCFALAGAALIALLSILPIFGPERHDLHIHNQGGDNGNLLFFGDIRKWEPKAYAVAVLSALGVVSAPNRLQLDLANQIVINSGITHRKFAFFKVAAIVTAISAVGPAAVLAFYWVGAGFKLY